MHGTWNADIAIDLVREEDGQVTGPLSGQIFVTTRASSEEAALDEIREDVCLTSYPPTFRGRVFAQLSPVEGFEMRLRSVTITAAESAEPPQAWDPRFDEVVTEIEALAGAARLMLSAEPNDLRDSFQDQFEDLRDAAAALSRRLAGIARAVERASQDRSRVEHRANMISRLSGYQITEEHKAQAALFRIALDREADETASEE